MADSTVGDAERSLACSFCDTKFSRASLREHLLQCGNKTDECPRCRKFVLRAVFAYHYENNCVNPEEFDEERLTSRNVSNTALQSSAERAVPQERQIAVEHRTSTPHLSEGSFRFERVRLDAAEDRRGIASCPYCDQECEKSDLDEHQKRCISNPDNVKTSERVIVPTTIHPNRPARTDESDDIPCEVCEKMFKTRDYYSHVRTCLAQDDQRQRDQARFSRPLVTTYAITCPHCGEKRSADMFELHMKCCRQNPASITYEPRYTTVYYLPPASNYRFYGHFN